MTSVILELLERAGKGRICTANFASLNGRLRYYAEGCKVSSCLHRVRRPLFSYVSLRLIAAIPGHSLQPSLTTESQALQTDDLTTRIGNLTYVSPRAKIVIDAGVKNP